MIEFLIFDHFLRNKLEYYVNKCNELEKDIADAQENHVRDTEEWKKFQADLQTAVRVANDFMTGIFFFYINFRLSVLFI